MVRCSKKTNTGQRCSRQCDSRKKTCWQHQEGGAVGKKVTCSKKNEHTVSCKSDSETIDCNLNSGRKSEHDFICRFINGSYECNPQSMYKCQAMNKTKTKTPVSKLLVFFDPSSKKQKNK